MKKKCVPFRKGNERRTRSVGWPGTSLRYPVRRWPGPITVVMCIDPRSELRVPKRANGRQRADGCEICNESSIARIDGSNPVQQHAWRTSGFILGPFMYGRRPAGVGICDCSLWTPFGGAKTSRWLGQAADGQPMTSRNTNACAVVKPMPLAAPVMRTV